MKKIIHHLQTISFCSLLLFGTGDSWANLIAVIISLAIFGLTTYKLKRHGM